MSLQRKSHNYTSIPVSYRMLDLLQHNHFITLYMIHILSTIAALQRPL